MNMKEEYLNNDAGTPPPKGGKIGVPDISALIEAGGKIAVGAVDAKKRREMEKAYNQQKLQAELGLQEKSLAQQYKLAQLNLLAQADGKAGDKTKKTTTIVWVVVGTLVLGLAGFVTYISLKNKS